MTNHTWGQVLGRLLRGEGLDSEQASWAMGEIMAGEATSAQIAAYAVLLRAKGETPAELGGMVATMLERANRVPVDVPAVDVVGTGGDGAHTVNISTMAALVTAGAGRTVVKHGNRAATSKTGTADVLEQLGVAIGLDAAGVAATVTEVGIGFCFAPVFHPGTRHSITARREIGVPTVFNFLGPLTNPARPHAAAIGCADLRMAPVMAQVLADRGDTALIFRGDDGLDELTTATTSQVYVVSEGSVSAQALDPAKHGIAVPPADALVGGDAVFNAQVVRDVVAGLGGPIRDAVLLNAAAAIAAFDGAVSGGIDAAVDHGLGIAADAIDSGAARALLDAWVKASSRIAAG